MRECKTVHPMRAQHCAAVRRSYDRQASTVRSLYESWAELGRKVDRLNDQFLRETNPAIKERLSDEIEATRGDIRYVRDVLEKAYEDLEPFRTDYRISGCEEDDGPLDRVPPKP
ncbi:MAG: hypothetical protein AAF732_17570 [Pseudomonadota bacterium]